MVGWPRDQVTGARLWPPVFDPPTSVEASIYRPRGSRGSCRPRANQTGVPTHSMVVNRTGRNSNVSQDGVFIQPFLAAEVTTHTSFNDVSTVLAPHPSPDATGLNPYQQHIGHFSPSLGHTSELSDSSSIPFNTPELSSSSRNSSVSALPDAYLPARNSRYGAFQFVAGSPYANHNSSASSTSEEYTPANSRSQSGSSHTLQDTRSDEAYKIIIRCVKPGVTDKQLSKLLDQKLPRYGYVQHEMPKQGEGNKWSVKFFKEEDAEKARERLNGISFKGDKLQVTRGNGGPRRQSSSSIVQGPIIVDGSVPG